MEHVLIETREEFYSRREHFSDLDMNYNEIAAPDWISEDSAYHTIVANQNLLYKEGKIAIAKIIQANYKLFEDRDDDDALPAVALYSLDPYYYDNLDELSEFATNLYDLKGEACNNPKVKVFVEAVSDEYSVLFNIKVPEELMAGRDVYYTTLMIYRKHLAGGYLKSGWFPLLCDPDKTDTSIVLPEKYWKRSLRRLWIEDGNRH